MTKPFFDRLFAALVALIAWSALIVQYGLLVRATHGELGFALATLRFFSFFTILSNLLVALITAAAAFPIHSALAEFLETPRVRGAAMVCVGITCGIYFFVLASTWAPQGLRFLADVTLHYVVPCLYLFWWLLSVPHRQLQWSDALRWLLLPLMFLIWTLLRGVWLHEYPYRFLDVDVLGGLSVTRNCIGIGLLFAAGGLAVVVLDGWLDPGRRRITQ